MKESELPKSDKIAFDMIINLITVSYKICLPWLILLTP